MSKIKNVVDSIMHKIKIMLGEEKHSKIEKRFSIDNAPLKPKQITPHLSGTLNEPNNSDVLVLLNESIKNGDLVTFKKLLTQENINLNQQDSFGNTLLHYATEYTQIKFLEELIRLNVRVDSQNKDEMTALHIIAYKISRISKTSSNYTTYIRIMEKLIRVGVDPKIRDKYGKRFFDYLPSDIRGRFSSMAGVNENPFRRNRYY